MSTLRIMLTLLMMIVFVVAPDYCRAATPITISTVGSGAYSISATDLPESAGIDLSITYNTAFLKDPVVTPGALTPTSSVMMVPNTVTPGFIRIGIITGGSIKGTGVLAMISFTKLADTVPQPILSTPSVYSVNGAQLAAQAVSTDSSQIANEDKKDNITNNNGAATIPAATGGAVAAVTNTSSGTAASIGTVSLPQDGVVKNDSLPETSRKENLREEPAYQNNVSSSVSHDNTATIPVTAVVASETKPAAILSALKSTQSVLDRFRTHKDIRTLKRMSILFDDNVLGAEGITQLPAIAVSDGKALVTVILNLASEADAPSFSLKGANLKSIKRLTDKKWQLEALPQKGKSDVRLSVILKGERIEIPLAVVPSLNKAGAELVALPVASLDALLAKPFKNGKPAYDLNADGIQDYVDDYILVAHWILKQQLTTGKSKVNSGK